MKMNLKKLWLISSNSIGLLLCIATSTQACENTSNQKPQKYLLAIAASIQKQHKIDEFSYFSTQPEDYLLSLGQKKKKSTRPAPLAQNLIYDTIRNNNISN